MKGKGKAAKRKERKAQLEKMEQEKVEFEQEKAELAATKRGTKSIKEQLDSATASEMRMAEQHDIAKAAANKASADRASVVQFDKLTAGILTRLLDLIEMGEVQGEEREVHEDAAELICSGLELQFSGSQICELLGAVANLRPELREAIEVARLIILKPVEKMKGGRVSRQSKR